jgi:hypothetical protein
MARVALFGMIKCCDPQQYTVLGRELSAPRKGAVSQWETVPRGKGRSSR